MSDQEAGSSADSTVLTRPSPAEAADATVSALRAGRVASLVGRCEVEGNEGGPAGDRLVLLKPDGSLTVHGSAGATPEFRFPGIEGGDVTASADAVVIDPEGGPQVQVADVRVVTVVTLGEGSSGDRTGHAAIRDRLLAEPDGLEPGFRPLATERETSAGPIDVYGRDADDRHVAVEIKAGRAGPAAAGQLDRYVEALDRDLHADAEVRGILVAPSATDRTRRLLDGRGYDFRRIDATDE